MQLSDLDDACILHIFSFLHPLPELFHCAATCRRLRDLALDRRSWLVVSHSLSQPVVGIPRQYRQQFRTLQEAIAASRPGDTIVLTPGEPHQVSDVVVPWPLHIMGGGSAPEQTVLESRRRGTDAALDFRAAGRLFNLTVRSHLSSCVTHRCGKLSIEQCSLECEAEGLDHLVAPIATLAASPAQGQGHGEPGWGRGGPGKVLPLPPAAPPSQQVAQPLPALTAGPGREAWGAAQAGPGVVSVVESKMKGGGMAVRLLGTGGLRSVRVIYRSAYSLFWFEVDSSAPGTPQEAQRASAAGAALPAHRLATAAWPPGAGAKRKAAEQHEEGGRGEGGGPAEGAKQLRSERSGAVAAAPPAQVMTPPTPALPAWMHRPPFDPLAFQQRVRAEMEQQQQQQWAQVQGAAAAAAAAGPGAGPAPAEGLLEKKAEQWSRHHAAAVGMPVADHQ